MAMDEMNLLMRIKVLDAKMSAMQLQMVADKAKVVGKETEAAGTKAKKSVGGFSALGSSMSGLIGTAGLLGVAYGLKDVISAGITWQKQQGQLQGALKNTGQYSKSTMNALQNAAESLSTHGGFSSEDNLQSLVQLTGETHDYHTALQALNAETDMARRTGLGLTRVQMMVQMALSGSTGRLGKIIGPITAVKSAEDALSASFKGTGMQATRAQKDQAVLTDKHLTAIKIIGLMQKQFAGSTATYSKGAAGSLSNLRNEIKLIEIQMGTKLLPIVTKVVHFLADFIMKNKTLVVVLISVFVALGVFVTAMKIGKAATEAFRAAQIALKAVMMANPWVLLATLIAVVVVGFIELYKHSKNLRENLAKLGASIKKTFGGFISAMKDAVKWVKDNWKKVLQMLAQPFIDAYKFVVDTFNRVVNFIKSIPGRIARAATNMWDGLKKGLLDALNWIVNQITGLPGKIVKGIGNLGGKIVNGVGSLLGLNKGGIVPGHSVQHFASGGVVQGGSGAHRDSVLAALTPGEGVLTESAMRALGVQNFQAIQNAGSSGGMMVGGDVPVTIYMDSRKVAEAVHHYQLKIAARK